MSRPEEITRTCAEILNELLKLDPNATQQLFNFAAPCDSELEKHPLLIVREEIKENRKEYSISTLGIINSILEKLGQKKLAAVCSDENNSLLMFKPYRGKE